MTERYSFAVDTSVWTQDNIDTVHSTLTDTINESYATAVGDSPSRYLSVLDTSGEMSLENLNINLTNPKLEVEEPVENFISEEIFEQPQEESNDQQVVVFSIEGSDELFGIQVAQDEEGNLQKYQFQFRKNEEGQLEAIPETIQLLPMEEEQEGGEQGEDNVQLFLQEEEHNEHILPDNTLVHEQEDDSMLYENEEPVDIKPAILSLQNIKQESQSEYEIAEPISEESPEQQVDYETPPEPTQEEGTILSDTKVFEHVEVRPDMEITHHEPPEEIEDFNNENVNDSDENDYQIVEGVHITGDVEPNEMDKQNTIPSTNILKHVVKSTKDAHKQKKDNKLFFYVVQHPEKENVDSLSLEMSNLLCRPKVNPRSILKSSHAMFQAKNEMENVEQEDERFNKRFARCKEAMQARIFNNFINKTTIPQAPVRQSRLPRKQKIKPLERMDEEIVVQEVMVSSTGFVDTASGGVNKENFEVTEYVELTDSDDDYDPKKVIRKKKKHRRRKIEITISDDSDASHDSVIELDETDDEEPKSPDAPKRRRGRPPKKSRVESNDIASKPEIPCPKCEKTFPSQNSLKTHLQHHNLQSSIKNALPESKYKCDDCAISFKNSILLKNHKCLKKFTCPVCKKKFPDMSSLTGHKRVHAKEQLVKSTAVVRVSPKKMKPVLPKSKSPQNKCKTCGKICSSEQNLNVHMKTHKEYVCSTCSATFVSQFMLEKHVRENCVKFKVPQVTRRSMRIKNASSAEQLSPKSPKRSPMKGRERLTMSSLKLKCDKCNDQFGTFKALFRHKVVKHNMETPDKEALEKEQPEEKTHEGVPVAKGLQNVWTGVNLKLDF
ncbi:protein suppressor of hairy wing [Tribolium castaneum]|uniref:C2H2-type domain-containing protein n=1 Tax=Tribolium castaneum TaxID=7070 RepID=D6X3U9_TRICA|nr:PREDICTED: protein suppressor of hairy wing [Tribolium castaneum]XP_015833752.1 PREDICTED: protein suppressor of hairy wing [Tribolium castaneum]XP_970948.1 PREDICTED: protein suppressor of hairy wing [Tribolium castaneum]EEZ97368.1 hypothetical protein TcasGA2_TC011190 [Tribolium castaneum]|eukprot:XP_008194494.1 PREDICTED: protein suppressor of hairy wing [Tribolium castaneum]